MNETLTDFGFNMRAEMAEQPTVLTRLLADWDRYVAAVAQHIPSDIRGVVFVGRGSSDNAATIGRYAVEHNAHVPAWLTAPSLSTRYGQGLALDNHLIVALSQSGGTPEIIDTALGLRGTNSRVIGVTNHAESRLAQVADYAMLLNAGVEQAVPATKTVTAQVIFMYVIASAIAINNGLPEIMSSADRFAIPDAVRDIIHDASGVRRVVGEWSQFNRLQVTGRGLTYGASLEAALKIKETTGVFAQAISAADFVHGPIAAIDSQLPVLVVDAGGPHVNELTALAQRLRDMGGPVATMNTSPSADLTLPSHLSELMQSIPVIVRGQQLALEWALAVGRNPDQPAGLNKMTLTF